ncbi:MAG: substrate-binding domain-containing protein [Burkholderiales bacterium]|nr:substrate-binding domain-containing protein [Burkholderiales bacterium]MDE1925892.1 substrate-binding domain-containing protein [Burkholderiales bacterium]MDE2157471.1 substrate-binding domain-containing protein [Burkholderiales bacterium]
MSKHPAAELEVLTTGILKQPLRDLAPPFEAQHGCRLSVSWGPSSGHSPQSNLVRVRRGAAVDVLLMVGSGMDTLISEGCFTAVKRRDIATSKIGVAVRSGHPAPDITTVDALRRCLLAAKSIAYSEGASGRYVGGVLFGSLGIAREVAAKSHVVLGQKFVGEAVADGEVEIGIQQLSELRLVSGITIVGPLPAEVQHVSLVSGAVSSKARNADLAGRFLDFLCSDAADDALARAGLSRPPR